MGDSIDVHCDGIDSKFPHYENEIAQSQGSSGKIVCNFVGFAGFVNIEGDECRKVSVGNFQTLGNACPTAMEVRAYQYLVVTLQYRAVVPTQLQNFEAALKDDLSMPRAAASLFALVKAAKGEFKRVDKSDDAILDVVGLQAIDAAMDRMDQVFANLLHGTWIPTRGGK